MKRALAFLPICLAGVCSSAQMQNQILEIRHITLGMTPQQVDTAATSAGMHRDLRNGGFGAHYLDPNASGRPVSKGDDGGHGLILEVHFNSGVSDRVWIREQGDTDGRAVTRDVAAKWGKPKYGRPFSQEQGWWGDPNKVWATVPSNLCMGDCAVIIQSPDKPTPNKGSGIT